MSAIIGIYCLDGQPVDGTNLGQMVETLAHRGPDDTGLWREGSIGLGHRMLWTTPESLQEKLPLANQSGDLVITADARIDNRVELMAILGLNTDSSEVIVDSQLILAAYEKWDERCLEYLLGDFAFAIWDKRRRRLFCARDPMGIKPFYYYYLPGRIFVFASEIKALLCLSEVPRRLNETRIADHLIRLYEDGSITFYQDIFRLPAAHCLTVDADGKRSHVYWSIDLSYEIDLPSDEAYAEAFQEVFTEAVRCRLRSAFPVGSTLSGGLDSSSIACTASNLLTQAGQPQLHTFSAIFPSLPETDLAKIDERPFVDAVLAKGKFVSHFIRADQLSPLVDLERILWHEDEAIFAPNLYMHWALYKTAHQQGVRIFLDGIDGDSAVSHGLDYLPDLVRSGQWRSLLQEATALSKRSHSVASPWRIIWHHGVKSLFPDYVRRGWQMVRQRRYIPPWWAANTAINPVFARHIGVATRVRMLMDSGSMSDRTARERHWQGLRSALYPTALEMADKAASAFTLEARYPFFDRRLLEFSIALPPTQKLSQGWTRVVLRRAMMGILPPEVQWRATKSNLSPNFKRRLLDYEQETLEQVILHEPHLIERYIDLPALRKAYRQYSAQPVQSNDEALTVYGAITLALWLRQTWQSSQESWIPV